MNYMYFMTCRLLRPVFVLDKRGGISNHIIEGDHSKTTVGSFNKEYMFKKYPDMSVYDKHIIETNLNLKTNIVIILVI